MQMQFFRIYLMMIAIVCLLLYSFNAIFQQVTIKEKQYLLDIENVFNFYNSQNTSAEFKTLNLDAIYFPEELQRKLEKGEIIALENDELHWTYYKKVGDNLQAFGPLPAEPPKETLNNYFIILFFGTLALFFLLLLQPLFKELNQLQGAALSFGQNPKTIQLSDINQRSSIYPLVTSFQKMSRQIVELLVMNRDISRTIAHEIRTPLSRMKFVLANIKEHIDDKLHSRIEQDIEEIDQLLTAYLNFAKIEHKDKVFNKKHRNISPLFRKLDEKFKIYTSKVAINFYYEADACCYDANHLAIALQNLISNAMRYAHSTIEVSFSLKNNDCKITVSDDGPGLNVDKLDLFDAFVRKGYDQSDKGFGLGLYIARRVAILHTGDLSVDNDPKLGGARFSLIWPNDRQ